jgi:hypothetical protein
MESDEIEVGADEDVTANFSLLHSVFRPDPRDITYDMPPDEVLEAPLTIANPGNGPLTWGVQKVYPQEHAFDPWSERQTIDAEAAADNSRIYGVAFTGEHFYVSGGSGSDNNVGWIFILDRDGQLTGSFEQFVPSRNGLRDLEWDGGLLWAADGEVMFSFTTDGEESARVDSPVGAVRSMAWDPQLGVMWVGETITEITAVSLEGEIIRQFNHPANLRTYGMGFNPDDPDGYGLYLFCRNDNEDQSSELEVMKMRTSDGALMLGADFDTGNGDRPQGLQVTDEYDVYNWSAVGVTIGDGHDLVKVWQVNGKTGWLSVDPVQGVVDAEGSDEITVTLNTTNFPENTELSADLVFSHDGVGGVGTVEVRVTVSGNEGIANRRLHFDLGWNLSSLNVQPTAESFAEVISPLVDEGILVLAKDGAGNFYWPAREYGDIDVWAGLEGYQFKLKASADIIVDGDVIARDAEIALSGGWNMVSYLPRNGVSASVALSGLGESLIIAKDGRGLFYLPSWGFDGMGQMHEGKGYQMLVNGDATLVYRTEARNDRYLPSESPEDLAWLDGQTNTGGSYSLLVLTDDLPAGTRLEASLNGLAIGRGIVDADGRCGMALWMDDGTTEAVEGFVEGAMVNDVEIMIRDRIVASTELRDGNARLTDGGWGVVELESGSSMPLEFGLGNAYPNPFNGMLRVEFGLPEAGEVSLAVYDLAGRKVAELASGRYGAGVHQAWWDASGAAAGVYVLRLTSGGASQSQKAVLLK